MEQVIPFDGTRRARRAERRAGSGALRHRLRRVLLAALQSLLAAFVLAYPLLRLGYLGPVPDGHALEAAGGLAAGMLALVVFMLERNEP